MLEVYFVYSPFLGIPCLVSPQEIFIDPHCFVIIVKINGNNYFFIMWEKTVDVVKSRGKTRITNNQLTIITYIIN